MPDPIWRRFGYGQLWPLQPACSQNRAGLDMPDLTSRIRFGSVLPKKARIILGKTSLEWRGQVFGHALLVRKQVGVQESPGRYQFPIFRNGPDHILQNQPGSGLVLADCIRFWPNGNSIYRVPGGIKRREAELDPQFSPEEIMSREVKLGCESWTSFTSGCSSTAVQRTLSL